MLRPEAPGPESGVVLGVVLGVLGVPVPTASTADWMAACAQQAHTK